MVVPTPYRENWPDFFTVLGENIGSFYDFGRTDWLFSRQFLGIFVSHQLLCVWPVLTLTQRITRHSLYHSHLIFGYKQRKENKRVLGTFPDSGVGHIPFYISNDLALKHNLITYAISNEYKSFLWSHFNIISLVIYITYHLKTLSLTLVVGTVVGSMVGRLVGSVVGALVGLDVGTWLSAVKDLTPKVVPPSTTPPTSAVRPSLLIATPLSLFPLSVLTASLAPTWVWVNVSG
jgi:hypothetical protein